MWSKEEEEWIGSELCLGRKREEGEGGKGGEGERRRTHRLRVEKK